MSTPVATIADALIAFIMSLLRDPAAVEEFDAAPQAVMASKGLEDACLADVQAVKPVIVDNPTVIVKPVIPPPPPNPPDDVIIREIRNIVNQFTTIDARTTIVDQSTNQNIWTNGGDLTQIFDQEAVVASGDDAIAAGDDATLVDSEVDVTIGDVSIGNTSNDGSFNNGSFNDNSDNSAEAAEAASTTAAETTVAPADAEAPGMDAGAIAGAAVEEAIDTTLDATAEVIAEATAEATVAVEAPVAEVVSEPAPDPLAADLTSPADAYEGDDVGAVNEEAYIEEPIEEQ